MTRPLVARHASPRIRLSLPPPLLFSNVIAARNEEGCAGSTVLHVHEKLTARSIPHEIIAVNDASTDGTWALLQETRETIPNLHPLDNPGRHGFGFAVRHGLGLMNLF